MNIQEALEILDEQFASPAAMGGVITNMTKLNKLLDDFFKKSKQDQANILGELDKANFKELAKGVLDASFMIRIANEKAQKRKG